MKTTDPARLLELRTTRVNDVTLALCGALLAPINWWASVYWVWTARPGDWIGANGKGAAFAWLQGEFGPAPLALVLGVMALWLTCLAIGGLWRLVDRRPFAQATVNGVTFHPSVGPAVMSWASIEAVELIGAGIPEIRFRLADRIWSPWAWANDRRLRLNLIAAGLSEGEASARVQAMEQLRGLACG